MGSAGRLHLIKNLRLRTLAIAKGGPCGGVWPGAQRDERRGGMMTPSINPASLPERTEPAPWPNP
ncbi:hypothetical protein CHT98_07405 (plasmid) [Azospirillum brasilense]|uniref:Uncharacterized protein n=1 Tax=Azospirillum brasilense TaxID=192 RepID=A0A235HH81_AZOBR|nr:hypothetical protein CHT98_07405 [Azospirillum brasilense]